MKIELRAVYDARATGLEDRGVACDTAVYFGDAYRKLREMAVIAKDVVFFRYSRKRKDVPAIQSPSYKYKFYPPLYLCLHRFHRGNA